MNSLYNDWYEDFKEAVAAFGDDELFGSLDELLKQSRNTFAFNRKLMAKAIDVSWVEAIENGLIHVDNVLRNPSRTIEDVEEIVPIERSRKITVESVKHLAQHTDYIQSIDKRTGKITPSKILNVHKEESYMTYENKFVNTLIDRLYIFISTRYEKLAMVAHDEEVYTMGYDTTIDTAGGGKLKLELKIETSDSLESTDASGFTIWQRVEKLKKVIEGYKGSDLCMKLGNTYIRPPVMRTNAIMKNVELKACLALWQYIESYDKVGYEINVENTAVKPQNSYIEDFYKLVIMNLLLFRSYTDKGEGAKEMTELKTQKSKALAPKFVKHFDKEIAADYSIQTDAAVGYVAADGELKLTRRLPKNMTQVFAQISEAIRIEKAYLAERERERLAKVAAEEEAERLRLEEEKRLEEQRRIEEAKREERERIRREAEEEERRIQELLERRKREQEEEEKERARLEAERQAKLEEQRRLEEEARKKREEEERAAAERERVLLNKMKMRSELGEAEGVDADKLEDKEDEEKLRQEAYQSVTKEEIEQAKEAMEESEEENPEFEDPREVAARMKLEQQKKEKERRERERAERLKAERNKFEAKPFRQIRWEYSKNPIRLLQRLFTYILAVWFHIIPEDTDDPDYRKLRADLEEKKRIREKEAAERDAMEVYYRKYAGTFKYRFRRYLEDRKFKKKRKLAAKNKPKPTYTPPKRTPEEQREIDLEMKRLYREYHVSRFEKIRRWNKERKRLKKEMAEAVGKKKSDDGEVKKRSKVIDITLTVIVVLSALFCAYVLISTANGKPVNLFGNRILQVVTGSMEPSIHVDDYIVVKSVDTAELKEGDIISFYTEDEEIKGEIVTHRIAAVNGDGTFVTRGDANPVDDSLTVRPEQVIGKYTGKTRFFIWLGSFGSNMTFKKALLIIVMIIVAFMSVFEIRSIARVGKDLSDAKKAEAEKARKQLIREEIEKEKLRLAEQGGVPEEVKKNEPR
ncbi:signal peptidase I [Ruminococcaceae bacterium FB2012]|nr:signal peptidase I [Ruminococcaceae bacterium FB2012]